MRFKTWLAAAAAGAVLAAAACSGSKPAIGAEARSRFTGRIPKVTIETK